MLNEHDCLDIKRVSLPFRNAAWNAMLEGAFFRKNLRQRQKKFLFNFRSLIRATDSKIDFNK